MVDLILGPILPYILAGLAAVAGIFYIRHDGKKAGRREVVDEIEKADQKQAGAIKEKLDAVATDGNALERLRKSGRLRD